ncbi:MAG: Ser-tRNA(Thr) hydrolase/threonyl-tRNA synthetase, threonyl-tRNA synthetase [Microgenomates group bacterium GW2011_GWC1_46_16]|uniref:Threonine--tRNA ligase n=2 Tax=Candidatus Collieribacteriota TaxID=1752725 RepID=A0A1F5FZ82_9BACT|nr:MAG: Threonine-tRNA ligase [Microgenomates group bacterium GW2011_GWF1_46_12]KKU26378.1 MAG: Ser-tRNA(Thr) hydrolase/threonyl-tRNA synthetase, threonyl-tRNA synthetase [Microgenomates group bacterium GW2011_GWC1_46_16]KKU27786.1 MAG: Threonine-tRNA ligase [Microgenomates group bacterium GW2011_GWF2_46_18]KKU45424.1 MAG: Threonine-tRNA ligase [Microgenomates group bacterium GW2011_GWB1_46_7]KKU60302.1 MAG: Threonine-tRNA ligase [Microgenomates group bacterium GW2011_GWE1_47_12]KKU62617.1 MAG
MSDSARSSLEALRHSAAHLLAAAIAELYPNALPTLGPAIETGFYYDFDHLKIGAEDFPLVEAKMRELVKTWSSFKKFKLSASEAKAEFKANPYKLELIDEIIAKGEEITVYQSGTFRDLCRGGHTDKPGEIKAFKLLSVAGAYWHGDEKNKMLTRIYGTAFSSQEDLDKYLWQIEEAKKRDHRKLGKELDLFTFSELVGSGLPLYTARGSFIRRTVTNFVESVQSKLAYTQVWTPQIAKAELFKKSGHYDKYKDDMFRVVSNYSDEEFFLKPMNCPQHAEIYASRPRSYRDLPLRLTDFAMLYRDEKPGELSGLARVRAFSQDDCHVYCREDQVDFEVDQMLDMIKQIMNTFGFTYRYRLSTRDPAHPEKYLGDPKVWDKLEAWAVKIMERNHIEYYDGPGEAAFYGPKMDLMATDALGREWQLSTVQIDYVQPERFNLEYTALDGSRQRPVTLHRAILGSPERLLGILIEHYAGAFPLWLSPTQLTLLPISEHELTFTQKLAKELTKAGLRVEIDESSNTLGKKILRGRNYKVPYLAIIGKKEVETNTLTLKNRAGDQLTLSLDEVIAKLTQETESKL